LYIAHSRKMSLIGGGLIGALTGALLFKVIKPKD
jgi:hypothetical protein